MRFDARPLPDPQTFRASFARALRARFALRAHMTALLLVTALGGFVISRVLLALGLTALAPRYVVAMLGAYALLFALVRAWLAYVRRALRPEARPAGAPPPDAAYAPLALAATALVAAESQLDPRAWHAHREPTRGALEGIDATCDAADVVANSGRAASRGGGGGHSRASLDAPDLPTGSGGGGGWFDGLGGLDDLGALVLIVLLCAAALAVFGAAFYFVWQAPVILADAAFELVLASALLRSVRRIDAAGWHGSLLRATYKPFAVGLAMVCLFGIGAQTLCPEGHTLPAVVHQCIQRDAAHHPR